MTRKRDTSTAACAVRPDGVPGCDTGPAGRIAFVARELADLWRELHGRPRPIPGRHIDDDKD